MPVNPDRGAEIRRRMAGGIPLTTAWVQSMNKPSPAESARLRQVVLDVLAEEIQLFRGSGIKSHEDQGVKAFITEMYSL